MVKMINFSYRLFGKNKIKIAKGNTVKINGIINGANILVKGTGNVVEIVNPKAIKDLKIFINGNNNVIRVEEGCFLNGLIAWIEDNNCKIAIDKNTMICGQTQLSCIEGCAISIGKDCMFSSGIYVSTGDAHSILNEKGERINPSLDITLKDHVWVGYHATILKGAKIEKDSIVGARAVVTKSFDKQGVVLAGSPAKVVKENINWDKERLPLEGEHGK